WGGWGGGWGEGGGGWGGWRGRGGRRVAHASAFAAERPTRSAPTRPGPCVTATASASPSSAPAWPSASRRTGITSSRCRRDATSGTTPPKRAWRSACEETTLARISPSTVTIAAAVSSHEVSTPRITVLFGLVRGLTPDGAVWDANGVDAWPPSGARDLQAMSGV